MAKLTNGLIEVQEADYDRHVKDSVCLALIDRIAMSARDDGEKLSTILQALEDRRTGKDFFGI